MSRIYRKYLKLLEKWPVDSSKKNRNLGEYLRNEVKRAFGSGLNFTGDEEECEANYQSLKRIVDNHYFLKYPRSLSCSASGLKIDEIHQALSDEFLEYIENEQPSISPWQRYKHSREQAEAEKAEKEVETKKETV